MSDLTGLLERVRRATGPDRRLDVAIHVLVTNKGRLGDYSSVDEYTNTAIQLGWNTPRVTASVDAALALMERELPNQQWMLDKQPENFDCVLWDGIGPKAKANCTAQTLPLAIVASALSALIAQEPQP